jgi:hypothetical protein
VNVGEYLEQVRAQFQSGHATEHSYRPALHSLFESIDPALTVIDEPKKSEAGMPDFLFQRGDVPLGWAEAKDIDKDVIRLKGYSIEQRKRYEAAYPNLIYTNGVDFEFIREGEPVHFVSIASFMGALGGLQSLPDKFDELERQLKLFAEQKPISIRSAAKLAQMMAAKAAIIKDEIGIALADDPDFRSGLGGQFKSFKANLLPALTPDEFADIYAETITYGMFAARFHDTNLNTFSRQEAMDDLPASNPFLKGLFEYIAGPQLPKRLEYIVDDLVQVMRASDPHSLFRDFGKFTARNDPFVHFYEDFLAAYNPKKRKSRGVWYTPEPVVDFIVRAVDDVLKTEFGLADGLADTGKVTVDWDTGQDDPRTGKPRTIRKDVHKVQILDPATGTGTFLAKAVQLISDRVKARAPGKWSNYVEQDLLPRLHGFELLMASYAMCHMKLDMMLTETGYKPSASPPRLSVWLTNSLEPAEREVRDLFFQPLAEEARGASEVKRQTPIMCVIGNPPYSGSSQNMGPWARRLVQPYKEGLNERKINLDDDYIKFIGLAESYVEKNGRGVVGFITNNSYLDGVTLRKMREHLLGTFDSIYVLNLFGDIRSAAEGRDENVFDITQGVAVVLMVKSGNGCGNLNYAEIHGSRKSKNEFLWKSDRAIFHQLSANEPYYFFYPKDLDQSTNETFKLNDLFLSLSSGIQTKNDSVTIQFSSHERDQVIDKFQRLQTVELEHEFPSKKVWSVAKAKADIGSGRFNNVPILYRPFDRRYTVLTQKSGGFLGRPRFEVMRHFLAANIGLIVNKKFVGEDFSHVGVSSTPICHGTFYLGNRGQDFLCPLYLYPEENDLDRSIRLNLDPKLYATICNVAEIDPADQAGPDDDFRAATGEARASEVKVFDYIYGVLHSPAYRETFTEFLKIDFPRIPYPPSREVFRHVSEKGEQLRRLHLMEPAVIGDSPYPYLGDGDDVVASGFPKFDGGKVHINNDQYFDGVPKIAWEFYIGGYQPAQKWLKNRRGRALSFDDITHYQRIVKILSETDRLMKEIELPLEQVVE